MNRAGLIVLAVFLCVFLVAIVATVVWIVINPLTKVGDAELRIWPDQSYLEIDEGYNYLIKCYWRGRDVGNFSSADLQWTDPDGTVIPRSFGDPRTVQEEGSLDLHFLRPLPNVSGSYTCSGIYNSRERWRRIVVTVRGARPPRFQVPYEALNFTKGANVSVECLADGEEPISYWWYDWSYQLIPHDRISVSSSNGSLLRIDNIQEKDAGSYVCWASNRRGTSNKTFEISVVEESPPVFRVTQEKLTTYQYSSFDLRCDPYGPLPMTFVWYDSRNERVTNSRYRTIVVTSGTSTLRVPYVQMSDAGKWVCSAANDHGTSRKEFIVTVELDGSPKFERTYEIATYRERDTVNLVCKASGVRPMTYTWYNPDEDVISSDNTSSVYVVSRDDRSTLVVISAATKHSGLYTCTARNSRGLSSLVFEVNITQDGAPTFSTPHENITAQEGAQLEILCCADNDRGMEKYAWYSQHKTVASNPDSAVHASATRRGSVLTISSANSNHSGMYECRSRNAKGSTSKYYTIQVNAVTDKPPKFEKDYEHVLVEEGSRLELECYASGATPITYDWINKNYDPISDNPDGPEYTKFTGHSSVLVIQRVSPIHRGNFICRGRNRYGMNNKVFEVSVYPSTENRTNETSYIHHVEVVDVTSDSVLFGIVTTNDTVTVEVRYTEIEEQVEKKTSFSTDEIFAVKGLTPGGFYTFRFRADNGSWSDGYNVTLLPDKPQIVVRSVQSDRVEIEWLTTVDQRMRGTIVHYEISYYWVQIVNGSYWTHNPCGVTITVPSCKGSSYIVTGMAQRSYYELQVRAATSSGFGEPSKLKLYIQ